MRFSEYQATRMNDNNNGEQQGQQQGQQNHQQQGDSKKEGPTAAQLLQRYRTNAAKDRKADKYLNQKVDLAEAAWAAKPNTYYAEMDQLIAQAREEEEATRQEQVKEVLAVEQEQQQQNKYQQPTYHQSNNNEQVPTRDYIDEKLAHVEASMQEKISQIEKTVDEKIVVALAQKQQETEDSPHAVLQHRRQWKTTSDCAMAGIGKQIGAPQVYIVLLTLLLLIAWWKSQGVSRKTSVKNSTRLSNEKKMANEDGWEDVVIVNNKSSTCSTASD
jgi:hypothetical protein